MPRGVFAFVLVLSALLAGCSSYYSHFESSADREVGRILDSKWPDAVHVWQTNARVPELEPPPDAARPTPGAKPKVLPLAEAIRAATQNNRSFKSQVETLYLSALSCSLQRRNYGPILTNTISYVYTNGPTATATGTASARLGVSQILPTGGTISASTGGSVADPYEGGGANTTSHDVTVSFEQPLLRGFGSEATYESLTQAERNVIYALRDFELYRQDFTIDVVRRYYAILRQKHVVENSRLNLEQYTFLRKRSDALFDIGRVRAVDKFRAAQEELTASSDLLAEQETLAALLDDFRVFLALPSDVSIDIEDVKPEPKAANINLKSAIDAALFNRLDLKSEVGRLEDAERRVRVARNGLLPDLDLTASASVAGTRTGDGTMHYDEGTNSVGLSLVLPLDKVGDRNVYKQALIDEQRSRRSLDLATETVKLDVLNTYRRLLRLANTVKIETANVELADKRFENAKTRFEAGELGNRDMVEAQAARLQSQNALIRAILDYEIARLQLRRDVGIFVLGSDGLWKE